MADWVNGCDHQNPQTITLHSSNPVHSAMARPSHHCPEPGQEFPAASSKGPTIRRPPIYPIASDPTWRCPSVEVDQPGEVTVTGRLPKNVVGSSSVTFLIGLPASQKPLLIFASGLWGDPRVLDALSLGVDWKLLNDLLGAKGRNSQVFSEARTSKGQLTRRDLQLTSFDPERARSLMAEAGLADGFQSSWCISGGGSTADFATVMGKFLDQNLNITFGKIMRDSSACRVAQKVGETVLLFDQPD